MNNPLITVIIPVYNSEKYFKQMLDSVFNQSIKNFDVIIVNDGSTDNTEKIIFKYMSTYKNIIYLKQENLGQSMARNRAIKYIDGKYTLFLDSDDYIDKEMFEKMVTKAENNNVDIVICAYKKVYENDFTGKKVIQEFCADENKVYTNIQAMNMMLSNEIQGYLCNKLFRSDNIINNNMYFNPGRIVEDLFPTFKQISLSKRIMFINEKLYFYRQHIDSTLNNTSVKLINDNFYACNKVVNYAINKTKVNKGYCYRFILESLACIINDSIRLKIRIDRSFYERYKMVDIKVKDIILNNTLFVKEKIKFMLIKLRILHFYYKVKSLIEYSY